MSDINYQKKLYLWCKMKGYSMESTFLIYRDILNKILRQFPNLETTTLTDIQEYAASIKNDHTRRNTCVLIRWAFNVVLKNPIDFRDLPYPKRVTKPQPIYSDEEAIAILKSTTNPKQKAILALIIDCGLRINEACKILLSDCSIDDRRVLLRETKGGGFRAIYPSQYVWDLLEDYVNGWHTTPTIYLFEGQNVLNPYTPSSIRQFVHRSCKICGVEYKAVHSFRRYLITWSIENKVDITAVADKVGHKGINTIQKHYLIHSANYLKSVASPLSASHG